MTYDPNMSAAERLQRIDLQRLASGANPSQVDGNRVNTGLRVPQRATPAEERAREAAQAKAAWVAVRRLTADWAEALAAREIRATTDRWGAEPGVSATSLLAQEVTLTPTPEVPEGADPATLALIGRMRGGPAA